MKTQIKIESCDNPYCVIHTAVETQGIKDIAEKIGRMDETGRNTILSGWDGDYCIQVKQADIYRIYSMDKKVYMDAQCGDKEETLLVKMRLYEFEEMAEKCGWTDFIRISNTDIVNFSRVTNLDMSFSGIVKVNFTNGTDTMVSRRYMNKIKDQLNLVRRKNYENN
ncbi:MAG: LytTR family transcriptional regulator [Treponema sp.]|nr:LytTR family transcriptional regulator [Treponema sp.]